MADSHQFYPSSQKPQKPQRSQKSQRSFKEFREIREFRELPSLPFLALSALSALSTKQKAIDPCGAMAFVSIGGCSLEQHRVAHRKDTLALFGVGDDGAIDLLGKASGILAIVVIQHAIGVASSA